MKTHESGCVECGIPCSLPCRQARYPVYLCDVCGEAAEYRTENDGDLCQSCFMKMLMEDASTMCPDDLADILEVRYERIGQ